MPRKRPLLSPAPADYRPLSLEQMLTHPDAFGLVTATNIQRAICRVADGEPLGELWEDPAVQRSLGYARPPEAPPHIMMLLMAIRCAKTMISAAKAICGTQNVDISRVKPGDTVRLAVLSTETKTAKAAFNHIIGPLLNKPLLRQLVVGEPTADTIVVRHPSGMPIEITVTAMSKAGSTLVGVWLAGVIFDEAPRMAGEGSAKSLDESLSAIMGRILPGGQIWLPGSPHAPTGPIYDRQLEHFGRPTQDLVIFRARGPDVNPYEWTPEKCEAMRRRDPRAYRTDVEAEFADPEEALISSVDLEATTRTAEGHLPFDPKATYVAAMDPATRGNAWTLVVMACIGRDEVQRPRYRVAWSGQWIGSKSRPLSPGAVLTEIMGVLSEYGLREAWTDQYSFDFAREMAEHAGLSLYVQTFGPDNRLRYADTVAHLIATRRLEVPRDPVMRGDLLSARRRVNQASVSLVLPPQSNGRHCDYMPALMLCVSRPPDPPEPPGGSSPHGLFADIVERLRVDGERSLVERAADMLLGRG